MPKKIETTHICTDLTPLNGSAQHEVHPLPIVDDTITQLAGAKYLAHLTQIVVFGRSI